MSKEGEEAAEAETVRVANGSAMSYACELAGWGAVDALLAARAMGATTDSRPRGRYDGAPPRPLRRGLHRGRYDGGLHRGRYDEGRHRGR